MSEIIFKNLDDIEFSDDDDNELEKGAEQSQVPSNINNNTMKRTWSVNFNDSDTDSDEGAIENEKEEVVDTATSKQLNTILPTAEDLFTQKEDYNLGADYLHAPSAETVYIAPIISALSTTRGTRSIRPPVAKGITATHKKEIEKDISFDLIGKSLNSKKSEPLLRTRGSNNSNAKPNANANSAKGELLNGKERVKRQRLAGQSGIGSDFKSWKSEEEMKQRQMYD